MSGKGATERPLDVDTQGAVGGGQQAAAGRDDATRGRVLLRLEAAGERKRSVCGWW